MLWFLVKGSDGVVRWLRWYTYDGCDLEIVKRNFRDDSMPIVAIARLKSKIDNDVTRE